LTSLDDILALGIAEMVRYLQCLGIKLHQHFQTINERKEEQYRTSFGEGKEAKKVFMIQWIFFFDLGDQKELSPDPLHFLLGE